MILWVDQLQGYGIKARTGLQTKGPIEAVSDVEYSE